MRPFLPRSDQLINPRDIQPMRISTCFIFIISKSSWTADWPGRFCNKYLAGWSAVIGRNITGVMIERKLILIGHCPSAPPLYCTLMYCISFGIAILSYFSSQCREIHSEELFYYFIELTLYHCRNVSSLIYLTDLFFQVCFSWRASKYKYNIAGHEIFPDKVLYRTLTLRLKLWGASCLLCYEAWNW